MMMLLQRVKNSDTVGYFYTPENKLGPGLVEVDVKTGEVNVIELSGFEKEQDCPYFASKARGAVKQMWDSGEMPDEKFFAWG